MNREATEADLASIEHLPALGPELKRLLREARIAIESVFLPDVDKDDLADSLQRFAKELANPQRNPERRGGIGGVNDLAPTVGHLLSNIGGDPGKPRSGGATVSSRRADLSTKVPLREYVETIDDRQIRRALEWAYAGICETLYMDGVRPEGPFDLLYFSSCSAGFFAPRTSR